MVRGKHDWMVGEKHPLAKLKPNDIIDIRRRYKHGESQTALASEFKVCQSHISRIVNGYMWPHIKEGL